MEIIILIDKDQNLTILTGEEFDYEKKEIERLGKCRYWITALRFDPKLISISKGIFNDLKFHFSPPR